MSALEHLVLTDIQSDPVSSCQSQKKELTLHCERDVVILVIL